jgi:hypothetical protein
MYQECGKTLTLFIQKRERKTLTFLGFDFRMIIKLRVEKLQSSSLVAEYELIEFALILKVI